MLFIRLQARCNTFLGSAASGTRGWKCPEVRVLDEGQSRRSGSALEIGFGGGIGSRPAAEATRAVECRKDRTEVGGVQRVYAVLPILTTERTDGHIQLH